MSSSTTTRELKRVSELVDAQLRSSFDKMKEEFLVSVKRDIIDAIKAEMKAELDELKLSLNSELADLKRAIDERDKTIEKLNARLVEVEDHTDRNESKEYLDVDVQPSDIDIAHRIGRPRDGTQPIIVKFANYAKRSQVFMAKKQLKGKENLTKRNQELLNAVKRLPQVSNAWTRDGKIFAKVTRDGGTPETRRFNSEHDVRLFENMPD
ncbi:hypothetical protein Bbelb_203350 [Branchiostoma belcheri]|nr:hypothetical protein Bbelb_203350 [Branchiostoma belcheri]